MIGSQDGKEPSPKVVMPNRNILQRSIIHLYPLECNDEEQPNQIPSKINLKVNRKREELKNDELRTEMNERDKGKYIRKKTAAAKVGNKILGQRISTFIQGHFSSGGNVANVRTFTNIETIWVRMTQIYQNDVIT